MATTSKTDPPTNPDGITGQLCNWVAAASYTDVPEQVIERAKYILLDGLACALVGARLPWCEKAVSAITKMETPGSCSIIGWEKKFGPLAAALLNSTFIQAFEIDDYHSDAPLHSESIVIPALLAAAQHLKSSTDGTEVISGTLFLLAVIVGFEVGPRIGHALYGGDVLTRGWHSGPLFGHAASAAAVSKLLGFTAAVTEDAIGTACTQTCGLMSAQFESDTKRMQHGFASRNGLCAALLSQEGFVGIKQVLERPYGGFLAVFSQGNNRTPASKPEEVVKGLGTFWETQRINIKPYASMAGTHPTIDCVRGLQSKYPADLSPDHLDIDNVLAIDIDLHEGAFEHGGWQGARPLNAIGAQMNNAYCAATQLVDGEVFVQQFNTRNLDRDAVWKLVSKTTCHHLDAAGTWKQQRVRVHMADGRVLEHQVDNPRGVDPSLSNEEVLDKARSIVKAHVDAQRWSQIEDVVLHLEKQSDVSVLGELLMMDIDNPIA